VFTDVLPERYLQLVYWGDGVPKGRTLAFDETKSGRTESIAIRLPRPATIRGAFDRSKFPDAGSVSASLMGDSWHQYEIELTEGEEAFEFRGLPPGEYSVAVRSKPVRFVEDGNIFFRISSLASEKMQVKEGEEKVLYFNEPAARAGR
jgi:hypothetical protein